MILTKISYFENKGEANYWEIKDVNLVKQNILVGLNATGKTRLLNLITNLAKIFSKKVRVNGNWELEFQKNGNSKDIFRYELRINNLIIDCERIFENEILILEREKDKGKIYSKVTNSFEDYSPPQDELTLNIRRDIKHYPFLEDINNWAKSLIGYTFSGVLSSMVHIQTGPGEFWKNLNAVPYLLQDVVKDESLVQKIVEDLLYIGYPIEKVGSRTETIVPNLGNIVFVSVKEKDLSCNTEQNQMSQGMFRALSLVVIMEQILKDKSITTILIDDLGEGLDFDRSSNLTKLLFNKTKDTDIQLIVTSNDRFLINSVELNCINYLKRQGHLVESINYTNSKDLFEKFSLTGLNNFDFLQSNIIQSKN
jgi:predicted ATPase